MIVLLKMYYFSIQMYVRETFVNTKSNLIFLVRCDNLKPDMALKV